MRQLIFAPFLLIAGCDVPTTPQQPASVPPPPKELCDQTSKALAELKAKGAVDHDGKGEATIMQDAWLRMSAGEHSQLASLLAFDAACASPDGAAERQVRIRNESGMILLESMVPVTVDLGAAD